MMPNRLKKKKNEYFLFLLVLLFLYFILFVIYYLCIFIIYIFLPFYLISKISISFCVWGGQSPEKNVSATFSVSFQMWPVYNTWKMLQGGSREAPQVTSLREAPRASGNQRSGFQTVWDPWGEATSAWSPIPAEGKNEKEKIQEGAERNPTLPFTFPINPCKVGFCVSL